MAQDLRELLKGKSLEKANLSKGHEERFEALLDKKMLQTEIKPSFNWMKVAAIAIVMLGVTFFGYQYLSDFTGNTTDKNSNPIVNADENSIEKTNQISLGDLSPDLKKVEEYYLMGINVQLASLKIDSENKDLVDGFMLQLANLDKEYKHLSIELNKEGPSEATITALIDNLKLRLELLFKLKNKLNELKKQENEPINNI
ncbi:MAG: hypothetical protein L3J09_09395 [Flavobacteriaceae bacterium]|nr:hypothetical protein [Flavobacteriaceae bacterium]